ncbi:MAG: LysR family transcriptional regulator [Myxococcota bacterium]|nr:LysR family transcriptional regulator [Myxococcota bacterium]
MKTNDSDPLGRLDLNKLHAFLTVAEAGGVSAAARRLALTPSAVSQSVSGLERALGVALFHRVGRRLVPTRDGETLRARLRPHHDALAAAIDEITGASGEVRGTFRIGLFQGFSRPRLARLLTRFPRDHPGARIRVSQAPRDWLAQRLLEGRLDYVVSLTPETRTNRRLRSTRLFSQELVLVSAPRLDPGTLAWETLAGLPLVDYYQSDPLVHRWVRHHFGRSPPALDVRVWAATTDLVLELVLARAGLAVLPRDLVDPHLRRGRLRLVPGPRAPLTDAIWLNELRDARPTASLQAFRQAIVEHLGTQAKPRSGGARSEP